MIFLTPKTSEKVPWVNSCKAWVHLLSWADGNTDRRCSVPNPMRSYWAFNNDNVRQKRQWLVYNCMLGTHSQSCELGKILCASSLQQRDNKNLGETNANQQLPHIIADVADKEKISPSPIIAQLSPLANVADTTLSATQFSAIMTPISPTHIGDNFGFKKTNGLSV